MEAFMNLKYISWLPAVIIMGMIFYFSSKPVNNSNESSLTIADTILSVYENVSDIQLQFDIRVEKLGLINHIVRKGAHFTEYALLACAIAIHYFLWKRKRIWWTLAPIIIAALYASTDEFHQTLVPGRGGQVKDVLLDTTGAITGILCFYLIIALIASKKKRQAKVATSQQ
jgi:VanZ family protein